MTADVEECFRKIIEKRKPPKAEPMVDGKSGFLYFDKNGTVCYSLHWEHYFKKTSKTIRKQQVGIRAFLFLLNNDCCTSIDKSRHFLSDLTGGKLNISKGMVSRLSREFALKTEAERKAVYTDMLLSPVMLDGFSCFPVYTIGILKSS